MDPGPKALGGSGERSHSLGMWLESALLGGEGAPGPGPVPHSGRVALAGSCLQLFFVAFKGYEDGRIDLGLTAYEKRGIALKVPVWDSSKCIQCNKCALVCPHAVIRPYLLNDE